MDPLLVDRIYEGAFVPEKWPQILNEITGVAGAAAASLFLTNPEVSAWTASDFAYEVTRKFIDEGWFWRGTIVTRLHAEKHAGFLRDIDILTNEEISREPIYRDMWGHYGVGWSTATAMPVPSGEYLSLVITQWQTSGPFGREVVEALDELRPHIARSALMASRLKFERARAAAEALALVGFAAAVLDESGKVLGANALLEAMTSTVEWRAQDRLALKDRSAHKLLTESLEAAVVQSTAGVRSFPVRSTEDGELKVAHVIPVRRSARDIFTRCSAVLVLAPVSRPNAPPVELVQSLFDLTPSEARVASRLVTGESVEEIAQANQVSLNTVRTHVRGVLEKTGCARRARQSRELTRSRADAFRRLRFAPPHQN